jgi:parallel beta-helix repeat protein
VDVEQRRKHHNQRNTSVVVKPLTQRKNWKPTKKNITRKVAAADLTKRTSTHSSFFIAILFWLFFSLPSTAITNSYTDVTVSEAKTMIDFSPSLIVLDARTQSEYDSGHIRNAKLIPHTELEGRLDELNKTDEVLVYCRSGFRSSAASQILADNGFLYVYNMLGGIISWIDEEYPVYVKYPSIQEAINNASEGDTIFVSSGKYYEHVVVNKTVSLVGENRENTLINGNGTQIILNTVKLSVNVMDFTIQNGTEGIHLTDYANSCIIKNCKIVNNSLGIFAKSDNNLLVGNMVVTRVPIIVCSIIIHVSNTTSSHSLQKEKQSGVGN